MHTIISLNIAFSFTVVIVPLVDGLWNKEKNVLSCVINYHKPF
jgi:hypothetical protein